MMGTPVGQERELTAADAVAIRLCAQVLAAGFPLVAFLQLIRVYVQSLRRIAEAEVRLFHLYVHEPLIRDGVAELEMAEAMGDLAAEIMPLAAPLTEYLHNRYLRYYIEQDVVGHMETAASRRPPKSSSATSPSRSASSTSPASPASPRRRGTSRRSTWSRTSSRRSRRRCRARRRS